MASKKTAINNIEKALGAEDLPMGEAIVEIEEEIIPMDASDVNIEYDEDGGATVSIGEDEEDEKDSKHEENLAEKLDDDELNLIGEDILTLYEQDLSSREEWENTYSKGMKLLGYQYEEKTKPFRGASGAHVPLLTEAILQFSSQAMRELMPSGGPVRTQIIGKSNRNRELQA
jgi:hypothetical protein